LVLAVYISYISTSIQRPPPFSKTTWPRHGRLIEASLYFGPAEKEATVTGKLSLRPKYYDKKIMNDKEIKNK
jgi:hypothetical protein